MTLQTKRKKKCAKCQRNYAYGQKHVCKKIISYKKIEERVTQDLTLKEKEHLACKLIKSISEEKNGAVEKGKQVALSQGHGKRLQIEVNKSEPKNKKLRRQMSAEDFDKISTNLNLSTNRAKLCARAIRVATHDRKFFEPNLDNKLQKLNYTLDSFFEVKKNYFLPNPCIL